MTLSAVPTDHVGPGTDPLAQRLHDPAVVSALADLLDHVELLAVLVEGLDQFVARSELIGDALIAGMGDLRATVQGNEILQQADVDLPRLVETARRLAGSELFSPGAVDQIDLVSRGLVAGSRDFAERPVQISGLFAAARLLKDPDINRALSFLATVARALGRELGAPGAAAAAPAPPG